MNRGKTYGYFNKQGKILRSNTILNMAIKSKEQVEAESEVLDEKDLYKTGLEVVRPYNLRQVAVIYEKSNTHRRCCDIKASDICSGYLLTPLKEGADNEQQKRIEEFLNSLAENIVETLKEGEVDYQALGESYYEIVKDGKEQDGEIVGLNHIPTKDTWLLQGKNIMEQFIGAKRRFFKKYGYEKDVDKDTGKEYELRTLDADKRANEFIPFKVYNPSDSYYGMPYVIDVLDAVAGDIFVRRFNNGRFENFGLPAGMITVSGNYNIEDVEPLVDQAMQDFIDNPQSVAVIHVPTNNSDGNVQIKFERIQEEQEEASFLEFTKVNKQEICEAHSVPLYMLGNNEDVGSLGGDNSDSAVRIYKKNVVEKRQNALEEMVNKLIKDNFKEEEIQWWFEFEPIDEEDKVNRLDRFSKIFSLGGATVQDLIANFGEEFGLKPNDSPIMKYRMMGNQLLDEFGEPISSSTAQDYGEELDETLKAVKGIYRRG